MAATHPSHLSMLGSLLQHLPSSLLVLLLLPCFSAGHIDVSIVEQIFLLQKHNYSNLSHHYMKVLWLCKDVVSLGAQTGIYRSDGNCKRPDGASIAPWKGGRFLYGIQHASDIYNGSFVCYSEVKLEQLLMILSKQNIPTWMPATISLPLLSQPPLWNHCLISTFSRGLKLRSNVGMLQPSWVYNIIFLV